MRQTGFAAIVLVAISAGVAHAEPFDARDWYRRVEALVESLIGRRPLDREVIVPPGNIDPKMALVPPPGGTMRIITPPGSPGRRPDGQSR